MISREEVAKKLRGSGEWLFGYSYNAAAVKAIGILRDATDSTYNYATLLDRLADLIDPTYHMSCEYGSGDDETDEYMEEIAFTPGDTVACHCHTCDTVFRYDRGIIPNYCPNCGARVVRDEA